jgi:DNA-binding transcriptional LysR family regulator
MFLRALPVFEESMQMRHFRCFIAAAEEGSFLKAASRLRVAQPSLSRQIRDLEREVGVLLFERMPRGVRLTAAGDVFLLEARNTLESAARAMATARREGATDKLRIGHGTLFYCAQTVVRLLASFRHAYPDTQITISRLNETKQRAALREQSIDVAIAFIGTPTVEGLNVFRLRDTAITGVVLPARHPLAAHETIALKELRELTWLRVSRKASPELYYNIKAALQSRGLSPVRERPRPRDPAVAGMHLAAGNEWMLASAESGRVAIEGNSAVVYRPFLEPPIPSWLALLSSPHKHPPTVERLIEVARQSQ